MDKSPTKLDYHDDMWKLQSTATLVSHFKVVIIVISNNFILFTLFFFILVYFYVFWFLKRVMMEEMFWYWIGLFSIHKVVVNRQTLVSYILLQLTSMSSLLWMMFDPKMELYVSFFFVVKLLCLLGLLIILIIYYFCVGFTLWCFWGFGRGVWGHTPD
jgi:hypothetical protein